MQGILLLNLGTPDAPSTQAVRRYLREFLLDPRVIDLPAPLRWLLVNIFILPTRPQQSAKAYQAIWTDAGSPLLTYSQALCDKVQQQLGDGYRVALGMRYGSPSIANALIELQQAGCDSLKILPLFPQYSSAATGSAIECVLSALNKQWNIPAVDILGDFFTDTWFIEAYAANIRNALNNNEPDLLLFSYHGLPERHLAKSHCTTVVSCRTQACPPVAENNRYCYRAQCYATSAALAQQLNLTSNQYQTSFQSRLGRTPWIQPYTDEVLPKLAAQGIKHLAIACPSFVTDCLETLEEIGIRAREQWQQLGGEQLTLVPCLNADDHWATALAQHLR